MKKSPKNPKTLKTFKKSFNIFPDLFQEKNISRFINISIFVSTTILLIQLVNNQSGENNTISQTSISEYMDILNFSLNPVTLLLVLNFFFLFLSFIQVNFANYFLYKKKLFLKILGIFFTGFYLFVNLFFLWKYQHLRIFESYSICICYGVTIFYYLFLIFNDKFKNRFSFFSCFEEDLEIYYHEYTYQLLNNKPSIFWEEYIKNNKKEIKIKNYLLSKKKINKKSDINFFIFPKKEKNILKRFFKKIKNIFIPFFTFKKKLQIGNIIYYPTKLIIAVISSIYIYYFIMKTLSNLILKLKIILQEKNFENFFKKYGDTKTIKNAIEPASYITLLLESIYLFIISIYLFINFKQSIIKLRKGNKKFREEIISYYSINFLPTYLSNIVIGNYLLSFFLFTFFIIIFNPLFWVFLWSKKELLLTLIITRVFMIIILYVMRFLTFEGHCVIRKRLLFFFDIVNFFFGIISGLIKQLTRAVYSIFGSFFLIFRVDEPVINHFGLDSMYHSYCGLMFYYHFHNNPIVNTFISIAFESLKLKNEKKEEKNKNGNFNNFGVVNENDNNVTNNDILNLNNEENLEKDKNYDKNYSFNENVILKSSSNFFNSKQNSEEIKVFKAKEKNFDDFEENEKIRIKKKRLRNKFYFFVFLAMNPSIVKYRKRGNLVIKK